MKTLKEINDMLDMISGKIKDFETVERKEIKKNNKLIDSYILELESVNQCLLKEMQERHEGLIPKEVVVGDSYELEKQLEKVKFLSTWDYLFKLGFDRWLYNIKYSNSLDQINDSIKKFLDEFKKVGIELNKDDFKYSISLYKYMNDYFKYFDLVEFNVKLKESFDMLYWECPEIVSHIYLCFKLLLDKYKDKFLGYIKGQYNDCLGYEEELNNYHNSYNLKIENTNKNEYLVFKSFLDGELRIDEYLDDSAIKMDVIAKFIDRDKYINMSDGERMAFYDQIIGIYNDLCECLWLNKYSKVIDKVKEIYNNKSSRGNEYIVFNKKMKALNKQREVLMRKLIFVDNRMSNKNSARLLKKYNNLFNKVNGKIVEIINEENNFYEIKFVNDVIIKLNEDSTYYDVFKIVEENYGYFVNSLMMDTDDYDECVKYLYNPIVNISKSILFLREINVEDKLLEKYDLFDIDINLSEKDKLKSDLEYIMRLRNFEKYKININNIKLYLDIRKILES